MRPARDGGRTAAGLRLTALARLGEGRRRASSDSKGGLAVRRVLMAELLPPPTSKLVTMKRRSQNLQAALVAAAIGTLAGVAAAVSSGRFGDANAAYSAALDLRDAPLAGAAGARSALIAKIAANDAPERLAAPATEELGTGGLKPRLIIIFDDMGIDRGAFEEVMAMPGPVTLSFLPYAKDVQPLVDRARARGDEALLHLPMEPSGSADPGPHSLDLGLKPDKLFEELAWNLESFEGYVGVNNHMGSKFTRDEQAMKRVLSFIDQHDLFFVDSLTTGGSAALSAGAAVGADVFVRDVFLDSEPGREKVERQLGLAEQIALKTGYAIVICHPRRETLDVIGPWLTTAPSRGFELATISALSATEGLKISANVAR